MVSRYAGGRETVYKVEVGQHGVAAYYRNSAVHWFVNRAILEVALLGSASDDAADPMERAWASAFRLRDLLKFEFFFSDKPTYSEELKAESRLLHRHFREHAATVPHRRAKHSDNRHFSSRTEC